MLLTFWRPRHICLPPWVGLDHPDTTWTDAEIPDELGAVVAGGGLLLVVESDQTTGTDWDTTGDAAGAWIDAETTIEFLLLEDGGELLLESGDGAAIVLEDSILEPVWSNADQPLNVWIDAELAASGDEVAGGGLFLVISSGITDGTEWDGAANPATTWFNSEVREHLLLEDGGLLLLGDQGESSALILESSDLPDTWTGTDAIPVNTWIDADVPNSDGDVVAGGGLLLVVTSDQLSGTDWEGGDAPTNTWADAETPLPVCN